MRGAPNVCIPAPILTFQSNSQCSVEGKKDRKIENIFAKVVSDAALCPRGKYLENTVSELESSDVSGSCGKIGDSRDDVVPSDGNGCSPSLAGEDGRSSGTPMYVRWSHSLADLLDDVDGIKCFREFLEEDGAVAPLNFYFACRGLQNPHIPQDRVTLAQLIYKRFFRDETSIRLKEETRHNLSVKIRQKDVNRDTFNNAFTETMIILENLYERFLLSDTFINFLRNVGEESPSVESSVFSVPSTDSRLPVVIEEEEPKEDPVADNLCNITEQTEDSQLSTVESSIVSDRGYFIGGNVDDKRESSFVSSIGQRNFYSSPLFSKNKKKMESEAWHSCNYKRRIPPNPYHVTYAPVSAKDSELASLSSDPLTDDTRSYTDSSLDGGRDYGQRIREDQRDRGYRNRLSQQAISNRMRVHVPMNVHSTDGLQDGVLPRTMRRSNVPEDALMANRDPSAFAALLERKLNVLLEDHRTDDRLIHAMRSICEGEETDRHESFITESKRRQLNLSSHSEVSDSALCNLKKFVCIDDDDGEASSILDEHVSRVWESASAQSYCPSRRRDRSLYGSKDSGVGRDFAALHHSLPYDPSEFPTVRGMESYGRNPGLRGPQRGISALVGEQKKPALSGRPTGRQHGVGSSRLRSASASGETYRRSRDFDSGVSVTMYSDSSSSQRVRLLQQPVSNEFGTFVSTDQSYVIPSRGHINAALGSNDFGPGSSDMATRTPINTTTSPQINFHPAMTEQAYEKVRTWQSVSDKFWNPGGHQDSDKGSSHRKSHQHRSKKSTSGRDSVEYSHSTGSSSTLINNTPAAEPFVTPSPALAPEKRTRRFTSGSLDEKVPYTLPTASSSGSSSNELVVAYYFGDDVPYRRTIQGPSITLAQFKQLIARKGSFRYFFKCLSDEFEEGAVWEEITNDSSFLPLWDGKVLGKVEKAD